MNACANCGHSNSETALFCQSCGEGLSPESSPRPVARLPAETRYIGFWWRVLGAIVDWTVVTTGVAILAMTPGALLSLAIPWLYEALMLSSDRQATIGKMAIRGVVTDERGQRLTFARASGRHFAKYLSALLLGLGFLMAAFTEKKQALHDLMASTLVVNESMKS